MQEWSEWGKRVCEYGIKTGCREARELSLWSEVSRTLLSLTSVGRPLYLRFFCSFCRETFFFFSYFMAMPLGIWDLSSLTKDRTCTPCNESAAS